MKRFKVSLAILAILVAVVSAYTTAPKHAVKKSDATFAVYANNSHSGSVSVQSDFSSQTQIATQTTQFTNPQLNSLAVIHCPSPNNIICFGEVNLLDGAQNPGTASAAPIDTRAGTFR